MADKKNIIVGAASIFIADYGTALPTPAAEGASGTRVSYRGGLVGASADWRDVGYTQDGLEVSTDPSFGEVEVDQLLDAAKIFKDGMGLSISTTMAEATLENLLVAWGQSGDSLTSSSVEGEIEERFDIEGGALGEAPLERALAAVGNGPEASSNQYKERVYHAFRVLSVEGSSHSLARADATVLPVTFRALPENDGRYGIIRDRAFTTAP